MSQEKYFELMRQLGKEPDLAETPVGWDDLPEIVQETINIYNLLPDKIYPEIGYTGKSYESLLILFDVYEIDNRKLSVEILYFIDQKAIKKASEDLKRQYDKLKNKK